MSSKKDKKGGKGKKAPQSILKCTTVAFDKKPKKDRKGATLILTFETASGSWTTKKVFDETWKFVESEAKSHKKAIGKYVVNASKFKEEYLNKNKQENAFKLIKDIFNHIGKNKKILSNDSKITAFIGAKRDHKNDIKTANLIGSAKSKAMTRPKSVLSLSNEPSVNKGKRKEVENEEVQQVAQEMEKKQDDVVQQQQQQQQQREVDMSNKQKEEVSKLKRAHLSEISALKQENHNLKMNNAQLRESNEAQQETIAELEAKCAGYEQELGKDQIGDEMASIFSEEFKKVCAFFLCF